MTSVLTKTALALAASASLSSPSAFAGTADAKATVEAEKAGLLPLGITATLESGYDSRYYFRGLWFADNTAWGNIALSVPITEKLSLGLGALYTTALDTKVTTAVGDSKLHYGELDLSASLNYDAGFAKFGLVYTHYVFFDTFSGYAAGKPFNGTDETGTRGVEELGFTVSRSLGPVNLGAGYYYDFTIGASYAELGADAPIPVTSWLSVVPAVKAGYGFGNYYNLFNAGSPQTGATHVIPSISVPVKLGKYATLTPYVAYNISLDTRHLSNATDNEFFGGVKLGVSF